MGSKIDVARKACLPLLILTGMAGCVSYGPDSPYTQEYGNLAESVRLPSEAEIREEGSAWTFDKSPDEVWDACRRVVSQYEGILAADATHRNDRRILFVHGHAAPIKHSKQISESPTFQKFLEAWIAVSIRPEQGGRSTSVAAAWISPTTGEAVPFNAPELMLDKKGKRVRGEEPPSIPKSRSASSLSSFRTELVEERVELASKMTSTRKPEIWMRFIPAQTVNEFFYHLAVQLYGEQRWSPKLGPAGVWSRSAIRRSPPTQRENEPEYKYAGLETTAGNWASARFRRSLQIIYCPKVTRKLEEVASRLATAAGRPDLNPQVFVVASHDVNAFVVPNGDIFVCSGLLETIDSEDEAAVVLAHELDHLYQHDTISRLKSIENAKTVAFIIQMAGAIAGPFAGVAIAPGAALGTASMSSQVLSNVAQNSIQMASSALGQSVGVSIIRGYSQKQELRADANGASYLWVAGYDIDAELTLLQKLKRETEDPDREGWLIASGFVNAQPGLENRIAKMNLTVTELSSAGTTGR